MPLTRCGGSWTEARYNSFIKGGLRNMSMRWAPIQTCKKKASTRRGFYRCAECLDEIPSTLPPLPGTSKRVKNVFVDHIKPIIDPAVGFVSWDEVVARMFCEEDNLAINCKACHDAKTTIERDIATARKRKERSTK